MKTVPRPPRPGKSLAEIKPNKALEWDYEANHPYTPYTVGSQSPVLFWWVCQKDSAHRWEQSVSARKEHLGCPGCSGQRTFKGSNDLSTTHPELCLEWHADNLLLPTDISRGASYKAKWECQLDERHVWHASVNSRTAKGRGCPYCAGRCPVPGVNDLATTHPAISSEWSTRNKRLAENVSFGSVYKATWVCKSDSSHIWETSVTSRVKGSGCPFCSNRKVLSGFNDLSTTHPELAEQWFSDNAIASSEVTFLSSYKAMWRCHYSHVWTTKVNHRTMAGSGCPYCSGSKVLNGFNDLSTTDPVLSRQWHESNWLSPTEVSKGSNTVVVWQCDKNSHHTYSATVNARSQGESCSICAGKRVDAGVNNLFSLFGYLESEWHPTKNSIDPAVVTAYSDKMIWWQCLADSSHEWKMSVKTRTRHGSGCPSCKNTIPSKVENQLRDELSLVNGIAVEGEQHQKLTIPWGANRKSMMVDILAYLPDGTRLVVEYDGERWHADRTEKDEAKTLALLEEGFEVVRVREGKLPKLSLDHQNLHQVTHSWRTREDGKQDLRKIVKYVESHIAQQRR